MGLHAVMKFIKTKYGHLYREEHVSLFAHQRLFMDIASYVFKYVCINGSGNSKWLNSFVNLMTTFRKNNVLIVPVFDGKAPDAKAEEQRTRREMRQKQIERTQALRQAVEAAETCLQLSEEQEALLCKEIETCRQRADRPVDLLRPSKSCTTGWNVKDLQELKQVISQLEKQNSSLSEQDFRDLKDLLTACGVGYVQAPGESEAYCSWLVRNGYGSAVISCDTDCLAYRADIVIFEVDTATGMIKYVNLAELLEEWRLQPEQMVDFGILVGCDYNPNSRKNMIGPSKAIKLLEDHKTIEGIPHLKDIEVLKHVMIRGLFNYEYDHNEVRLEYHEINQAKIDEICSRRPDLSRFLINTLISHVTRKPKIVVLADESVQEPTECQEVKTSTVVSIQPPSNRIEFF